MAFIIVSWLVTTLFWTSPASDGAGGGVNAEEEEVMMRGETPEIVKHAESENGTIVISFFPVRAEKRLE